MLFKVRVTRKGGNSAVQNKCPGIQLMTRAKTLLNRNSGGVLEDGDVRFGSKADICSANVMSALCQ